jgi:hypothetical protein
VIATKKDKKAAKYKEAREQSKKQAMKLQKTEHELQVSRLETKYERGEAIAVDELDGLKKKELAKILHIDKYERLTLSKLQEMVRTRGEDGEESGDEGGDEEDPDKEVCDLIVRLRRTPSGNNWEHAGPALHEQHAEDAADV